jgi:hypothetical protein
MIRLTDILLELQIKNKKIMGSGYQQSAYPFLKNPNYVIKKFSLKWFIYGYIFFKKPYIYNV